VSEYSLKKPCSNCPFRTDVTPYLRVGRVQEMEAELIGQQRSFTCHKTTVAGEDDEDGSSNMVDGPNAQHCAGAMILLEKSNAPNQMMRIAERLGLYKPSELDMDAPVYDSFREMREAQGDFEPVGDPCNVVNYGCEAPAGYMSGGGVIDGTEAADYTCYGCGDPVCGNCSKDIKGERTCDHCAEDLE